MAIDRDFKLTSISTNQTNFTADLPDDYQTGDTLLFFVAKDSGAGDGPTTPAGWNVESAPKSEYLCRAAIFSKENVTAGSEVAPTTTSTDSDTWTGIIISIRGVSASAVVESIGYQGIPDGARREIPFTSHTTLTDNCLALHVFISSSTGGAITDANIIPLSLESGLSGESIYVFKETVPVAGPTSSGIMYQDGGSDQQYYTIIIKDGSSGAEVEPYQSGGGLQSALNTFSTSRAVSWLPSTVPSGITTDAHTTYGTVAGVPGKLVDQANDSRDGNVIPYVRAFQTRGDINDYQGLRFEVDRTEGGATVDLSSRVFVGATFPSLYKGVIQIGDSDTFGVAVILEDSAGNSTAWCVVASDIERRIVNPDDGPFFINPSQPGVDSSGTLDVTDVKYMSLIVNAKTSSNLPILGSNMITYEPIEISGGSPGGPLTHELMFDIGLGNLHRFYRAVGSASLLTGAWHIGNGTTPTYCDITNRSIEFPRLGVQGACYVPDGYFGYRFRESGGDLNFSTNVVSSPSPWKWDESGGGTYIINRITGCKPLTVDTGDYTGSSFIGCGTVDQGAAIFDDVTIDGSIDGTGMIWGTGSNTNMQIKNCDIGIEVDAADTITLDGTKFTDNTVDLDLSVADTVTIQLTNGADTPSTTTSGGGTILIKQDVPVTGPNIIDDSRVQLYNVSKSVELDNSVVTGGGYAITVNLKDANIDVGDILRLRAVYQYGIDAKEELSTVGIITTTGLEYIDEQAPWDAYNKWLKDGETVNKFAADYVNTEVDIIISSNYELREFGAWWVHNLTTEDGIRNFFGGITTLDENNLLINNDIVDIYLNNNSGVDVWQTDNRRLMRADGARPVRTPTTSGGVDVEWRSRVDLANSDAIQLALETLENLAKADEVKDIVNNKYFKKEAGTETILLEKDYTNDASGEALTEA